MRERGIPSVDGPKGLAAVAQVSRNTIYAWEGGAYPGVGELQKVAKVLELPAWQLLQAWEGTSAPSPPAWVAEMLERLQSIESKLSEVPDGADWKALAKLAARLQVAPDIRADAKPRGSQRGGAPPAVAEPEEAARR